MINLLLILLCGMRSSGTVLSNPGYIYVMVDGDSNTNSWYQNDSTWVDQLDWRVSLDYDVINVAWAGKTVYQMIQGASAAIDVYNSPYKVCYMWGIGNDINVNVDADSGSVLIEEFCLDRQAAGFHMVIMTALTHDNTVREINDSTKVHWATFADEIILIDEAPHIGIDSDNTNSTYWWDVDHLTVFGLSIVADSVYKHLDAYMISERGYL